MIKVEHGNVEIIGSVSNVCTDLTLAIKHVKEAFANSGMPKEKCDMLFSEILRAADMTPEEIAKETIKNLMGLRTT